jgi:hypothetical protein
MKKLKYLSLFEEFNKSSLFPIEPTLEVSSYELFNNSTGKVIYNSEEGKQKNPVNIDKQKLSDIINNVIDKNPNVSKKLAMKQINSPEGNAIDKMSKLLSFEGDYDNLQIRVYFKNPICLSYPSSDVIINKIRKKLESDYGASHSKYLFDKGCASNILIYQDTFVRSFEKSHPEIEDIFRKYQIANDDFVKKISFLSDIGIPVENYLREYITEIYNNDFDYFSSLIGYTLEDL